MITLKILAPIRCEDGNGKLHDIMPGEREFTTIKSNGVEYLMLIGQDHTGQHTTARIPTSEIEALIHDGKIEKDSYRGGESTDVSAS